MKEKIKGGQESPSFFVEFFCILYQTNRKIKLVYYTESNNRNNSWYNILNQQNFRIIYRIII